MIRQRFVAEAHGCRIVPGVAGTYALLEELSRVAGMRVLVPPLVVQVPVACAADQIATSNDVGVSGQVIWLESGAQVHTWPEHRMVTLDMFSCKPFDFDRVEWLLRDALMPKALDVVLKDRKGEQ